MPDVLIIGGSGFLSGTLATTALAQGHRVQVVTRGHRPVPPGVEPLIADRKDRDAFARTIAGTNRMFDLVVDCIGYEPDDARQDIDVLRDRTGQFVFVSTDFVFDPRLTRLPRREDSPPDTSGSYGRNKRLCEQVFEHDDTGSMQWTVFRPCHIYGPGSQLGCLPEHGRDVKLIERIRAGEALRLVGGGHFLQQPIFATDLAKLILSVLGNDRASRGIFCAAGPEIVESSEYYRIIGRVLGCEVRIEELPVETYQAANPNAAPFLCHRIYDLSKLRQAGLHLPATPLEQGLREHVQSLLH